MIRRIQKRGTWAQLALGGFMAMIAGCTQATTATDARLSDVPALAGLLASSSSTIDCMYVHYSTPRAERVCVIGRADSLQALEEAIPFLHSLDHHPGADSLNSTIPSQLKSAWSGSAVFEAGDVLWIGSLDDAESRKELGVYAGYSEGENMFYLDCRWDG